MVFDERPSGAAPRFVQRTLVIVGIPVVALSVLVWVAVARLVQPMFSGDLVITAAMYVLPLLLHLFAVRLVWSYAVTARQPARRVVRHSLYKISAFIFLLNVFSMLAVGNDFVVSAAIGIAGALGPMFLAGLLDEETGIWLTHKNTQNTADPDASATCR